MELLLTPTPYKGTEKRKTFTTQAKTRWFFMEHKEHDRLDIMPESD